MWSEARHSRVPILKNMVRSSLQGRQNSINSTLSVVGIGSVINELLMRNYHVLDAILGTQDEGRWEWCGSGDAYKEE